MSEQPIPLTDTEREAALLVFCTDCGADPGRRCVDIDAVVPAPDQDDPHEVRLRDVRRVRAAALAPIQALHVRETRWQPHPDAEFSFGTREEAVAYAGHEDVTSFEVCAECGRIEMADDQRGNAGIAYLNALWPCATARAAGVDAAPNETTTEEGL